MIVSVTAAAQAPTLQITQPDGPNLPSELWYGNVKVKPLRFRPGTNTPITIDDKPGQLALSADFLSRLAWIDSFRQVCQRDASPAGF